MLKSADEGMPLRPCKVTKRKSSLPKDPNFEGLRRIRFSAVPEVKRARGELIASLIRTETPLVTIFDLFPPTKESERKR